MTQQQEQAQLPERAGGESELHYDIMNFLTGEFARKAGRQCVKMILTQANGGFGEDAIHTWDREDEPDTFQQTFVEELAAKIVTMAEGVIEAYGSTVPRDGIRFELRTRQHLGTRNKHMFRIRPTASQAGGDAAALTGSSFGGQIDPTLQGVLAMQMRQNEKYNDNQQQMFKGTIGVLLETVGTLKDDCVKLRAENSAMRAAVNETTANEDERMMRAVREERSDKRKDQVVGKVLQLAPIVAAGLMSKGATGAPNGIALTVNELANSLSSEQVMGLIGALNMEQRALFASVLKQAKQSIPQAAAPADGGEKKAEGT